jgi:hypothetical protein
MKSWPKDPSEAASCAELLQPLQQATRFLYKLEPQNKGKQVPYEGFNLGERELVTCFPADQMLTPAYFREEHKQNDAEPIDVVLHLAFLLGMEQGRRTLRKRDRGTVFPFVRRMRRLVGRLKGKVSEEIIESAEFELQVFDETVDYSQPEWSKDSELR